MKVSEWLEKLNESSLIADIHEVELTVSGKVYRGAAYAQHNSPRIMVLGKLPGWYKQRTMSKYCHMLTQANVLQFPGDDGCFYVICYWQGEKNERHPFGPNFILGRWEHELIGPIDEFCDPPINRLMASIKEI